MTMIKALTVALLCAAASVTADFDPEGHCIWYGRCGPNPNLDNDALWLNCLYEGEAKPATSEDISRLLQECPHFAEDFPPAEQGWVTCCSSDQITDIAVNFDIPEGILNRCPSCLANFRKNFCDLTCRPDQSKYLNVSKTYENPEVPGKGKEGGLSNSEVYLRVLYT
jgi:Niemann-Pick C1 protein